ncbi:hypothetical protein BDN72DRAFT_738891, partial [Pluteus cervinus]
LTTNALVDSGATGSFIDRTWAERNKVKLHELARPIEVVNSDKSKNSIGAITHYAKVEMETMGHRE